MNDQTIQLINQLAAKLGTTADHLWVILVRQAYVTVAVDVVLITACIFAARWGLTFVRKLTKDEERYDLDVAIVWVVYGIVVGFLAVWCLIGVTEIIENLINPEYYAFKKVASLLGK